MSLDLAPDVAVDKVKWRVDGKPSNNRARFVPYVDASIIATLLDTWVGPENWRDEYAIGELNGKPVLWCSLSIRIGDEWVTKRDVGMASNFEAQKGMVSDAFKRTACLKWGVARNVYDMPTLWAPCRVDEKGNAWPNNQTIPDIQRQLGSNAPAPAPTPEAEAAVEIPWYADLVQAFGAEKVIAASERIREFHGTGSTITTLQACLGAPPALQEEIGHLLTTGELPNQSQGVAQEGSTPEAASQPETGSREPKADSAGSASQPEQQGFGGGNGIPSESGALPGPPSETSSNGNGHGTRARNASLIAQAVEGEISLGRGRARAKESYVLTRATTIATQEKLPRPESYQDLLDTGDDAILQRLVDDWELEAKIGAMV